MCCSISFDSASLCIVFVFDHGDGTNDSRRTSSRDVKSQSILTLIYLEPTLSHQLYLILSYGSMLLSLWYLLVRNEYTSKRYNR